MKVFIAQDITSAGKEYLTQRGYEIKLGSRSDEETIRREAADCDAILVRTASISRETMQALPKLKVIARHGVGVDAIDVEAATQLGIQVTNGPLSNYESVAEHTVALIMACAHHIVEMDHSVRRGNWAVRNQIRLTELNGKTVGIVGLGRIGREVAAKLFYGFHMQVLGFDRYVAQDTLPDYINQVPCFEELLSRSDFVTLHCPATPETHHLMNESCLAQMKPSAYLINCARGEIVDEEALYQALRDGILAGAGLDVMEAEPPKSTSLLLTLPNVIFSPHCSAHTAETFDRMGVHAAMGIDEVLSQKKVSWPVNHPNL